MGEAREREREISLGEEFAKPYQDIENTNVENKEKNREHSHSRTQDLCDSSNVGHTIHNS